MPNLELFHPLKYLAFSVPDFKPSADLAINVPQRVSGEQGAVKASPGAASANGPLKGRVAKFTLRLT